MSENQHLLSQLERLLRQKKSTKFYAEKLGIQESDVKELLKQLKDREYIRNEAESAIYIAELEDKIVKFEEGYC
jgi:Mn-dependent DtxR family transcriptional regulator